MVPCVHQVSADQESKCLRSINVNHMLKIVRQGAEGETASIYYYILFYSHCLTASYSEGYVSTVIVQRRAVRIQIASVLGRLCMVCPFSLEKSCREWNRQRSPKLLEACRAGLTVYHVFQYKNFFQYKDCQTGLVVARFKANKKEIIQVILYAELCGTPFWRMLWVQEVQVD